MLDYGLTRFTALQMLLVFTHDGCRTHELVLKAIAGHSQILSRVIRSNSSNRKDVDLALVVMAHSMRFLASGSSEQLQEDAVLRHAVQTAFDLLRKPHPSKSTMTHCLMLLMTAVQYVPERFKQDVVLNSLLVALLHAKDIVTRVTAMEGMLVLCQVDSGLDSYEVDLQRLEHSLKHPNPPPVPLDFVTPEEYPRWLQQSDSALLHHLSMEYVKAMSQAVRDRDLVSLGRSVADMVQRCPLIVDGSWEKLEQCEGQHGHPPLPISLWSDALPESAKALRLNGTTSDRDAADVLDLKFFMLRNRDGEATALAREIIERNPENAFACYVVSLGGDMDDGLHAATRGLRCPKLTPFLRKQLLWRVVELEAWQGFEQLLTAEIGNQRAHEQGIELLRTAYEHTETFLTEASPDAHLRVTMLGWRILLTFVLRGSELSDDLSEIQVACFTMT